VWGTVEVVAVLQSTAPRLAPTHDPHVVLALVDAASSGSDVWPPLFILGEHYLGVRDP
jgi:hypothetical protein